MQIHRPEKCCIHYHISLNTHTHVHTHTYTYARTNARTHTRTHACMHTYTHTHSHTGSPHPPQTLLDVFAEGGDSIDQKLETLMGRNFSQSITGEPGKAFWSCLAVCFAAWSGPCPVLFSFLAVLCRCFLPSLTFLTSTASLP